jgi:hypothetical protein
MIKKKYYPSALQAVILTGNSLFFDKHYEATLKSGKNNSLFLEAITSENLEIVHNALETFIGSEL